MDKQIMWIVGGQIRVGLTDKEFVDKQIGDGEAGMGLVGQWIDVYRQICI